MNKKRWAIGLFIISIFMRFFPQWNGLFFSPSQITTGEGRIIAAIFLIGGLFLRFSERKK